MIKRKIYFITLLLLLVQVVMAQSLSIEQPLKEIENSSVLAQYKNQFGQHEMPEKDTPFPFALIVMHLDGSALDVKTAKEMIQLDLGTQKMVVDQYREKPNEIWFLVENTVKNIYIDCGEGCEKQLLASGLRLRPNTVYMCQVHYEPEEDAITNKGHVKWDIQPADVADKTTIQITSLSGKNLYTGSILSDTLIFLDYSIDYPYVYSICCPLYATHTDTIRLSEKTESVSATLKPCFNYIRVKSPNSTPILFSIDQDLNNIYNSNNTNEIGPLEAGRHILRCVQELHEDQDVQIDLNGDCTTKEFTPNMIHSVGGVIITSTPSSGDVYIDNELVGKTPYKSGNCSTGKHQIKVVLSGYVPVEQNVNIERGLTKPLDFALNSQANVYISVASLSANLYISPHGQSNYTYLGEKSWSGELGVGKYDVKTTALDHDEQITTIEVKDKSNQFVIADPPHQVGYLSVIVHPVGASIYVDDQEVSSKKIQLSTGKHTVHVAKQGYFTSDTRTITITNQATTKEEFTLSNQWIHGSDSHPCHDFEITYGFGWQRSINHYIGASYGYMPKHFGVNVSGLYGITSQEVVLTAGPSLRLTSFGSPLSLQLALGAGGVYNVKAIHNQKISWAADSELRFAFKPDGNFAWYSFGLGLKYFNQQFVPTFNLSLIPIRACYLLTQIEEDFPAHRLEAMAGYSFSSHNWRYGFNYSWTPAHMGLYSQMLFGGDNNYSITAGPTFRLTSSSTAVDLQLYQGIGWFRDHGDMLGGETGLRLAFDNVDLDGFGWWSLNAGFEYAQNGYYGVNFGLSLMPIGGAILLGNVSSDFPEFRFETVAGCGLQSGSWKLGYNFSWNATAIGCYTQMLFGLRDNYSITVGPTFRLTPMLDVFDLQLYQGIGWFRDHGDMLGGETGLRLAFSNSNNGSGFGWWSLNLGCEYAQDGYVGINFGVSLGIVGLVGTCGLLAFYL